MARPVSPRPAQEEPSIRTRTRILIIDDHAAIARGLQQMLAGSPGLEVLDVLESGATALKSIAEHEPTAVIVDTILEGLSGSDLIRQIRRRYPQLTIVAMSASVGAKGERQLIEAGANAVLRKSEVVNLRDRLGALNREAV